MLEVMENSYLDIRDATSGFGRSGKDIYRINEFSSGMVVWHGSCGTARHIRWMWA